MIYDALKNAHLYFAQGSRLAKAIDYIKAFDSSRPDGRYEIDDTMYASVSSYQTKPAEQQTIESHRRYIDVQAILSGRERIDVALFSNRLIIDKPYDETKDAVFYKTLPDFTSLNMTESTFAVFYPQNVHRPCCNFDNCDNVRKIVVKIMLL